MNTEKDYYLLDLVMTEDYSTLTKEQLVELVKYQQERITEYYEKEVGLFFGDDAC